MTGLPVPVGTRVELVSMKDDPDPVSRGTQGVVTGGNAEQIWVDWDNGRRLALVVGVDTWHTVTDSYDSPVFYEPPKIVDHSDWPVAIGTLAMGLVEEPNYPGMWFVTLEMCDGETFAGALMAYESESYLIVLAPVIYPDREDPDVDDVSSFIQLPAEAVKTFTIL